jgi:hypothetical protein
MKPSERRLSRERPASLPTANLTADIRPAGAVPSQQSGTATPGCARGAKTNPDPTSPIRNLILQKDCRTTLPSPCTPFNCINVLESYSCAMLKIKPHGMIFLRKTTIRSASSAPSEPRDPKELFYNVLNTSFPSRLSKPFRMTSLQKGKNKPSAITFLQKKVGGTLHGAPQGCAKVMVIRSPAFPGSRMILRDFRVLTKVPDSGDMANPFRIRTYGNKELKSFRMRTYEKDGRGAPVARAASTQHQ